ncbi:MAG: DUF1059 domain-containing protein [Chloroflexi bacterium]|jgi:predicted small metal-binding protein|nr:DUF1059 domain-containing protein [Chloroflexota bacterium]
MEPKRNTRLRIECPLCGLPIRAEDEDQLVQYFREHMWEQHRRAMSEDTAREMVRATLQASAESRQP